MKDALVMFNEPECSTMTKKPIQLVPLAQETRTALPTSEAASHLNREDQTLRVWASRQTGPIRPIRVNGRLAWLVADIRSILGVAA